MTAFIFYNSLQNATESSKLSGGLLFKILALLPFLKDFLSTGIFRKIAHFIEFFTQGTFLSLGAGYSRKGLKANISNVALAGLLTACCDEYLQTYSVGRSPEVRDIFIDFGGTALALLLVSVFFILRRIKNVRF